MLHGKSLQITVGQTKMLAANFTQWLNNNTVQSLSLLPPGFLHIDFQQHPGQLYYAGFNRQM